MIEYRRGSIWIIAWRQLLYWVDGEGIQCRSKAAPASGALAEPVLFSYCVKKLQQGRTITRIERPGSQNSLWALTSHFSVTGVSGWPFGFFGT